MDTHRPDVIYAWNTLAARAAMFAESAPQASGDASSTDPVVVAKAIDAYAKERRAQVSPRMVAYWAENARPLGEFFGTTALRHITPEQIAACKASHTGRFLAELLTA